MATVYVEPSSKISRTTRSLALNHLIACYYVACLYYSQNIKTIRVLSTVLHELRFGWECGIVPNRTMSVSRGEREPFSGECERLGRRAAGARVPRRRRAAAAAARAPRTQEVTANILR